jgi:hypothetical protein
MADASRFPNLALPFAILGASAGWISAGFLANPLVAQAFPARADLAALCAAGAGAAAGLVVRRMCVGRRYAYQIEAPDPEARPRTDAVLAHVGVVLGAGAAAGAVVAGLHKPYGGPAWGLLSGSLAALAFVPVFLAVLSAARRAQRARLGSMVAGSDRRAVWAILATTLALATAGALPEWPAAGAQNTAAPWPALLMLAGAALVVGAALLLDRRALRRAEAALLGVSPQRAEEMGAVEQGVPHLDLGLGEGLAARLARSAAAYRGRDRALALVQGSPELARAALRRAVLRDAVSLALIAAMAGAHAAASTAPALRLYGELRCRQGNAGWCLHLAGLNRI